MNRKIVIIFLIFVFSFTFNFGCDRVYASPDADYSPNEDEVSEEDFTYEDLMKCEKDDTGIWSEKCDSISDEIYKYKRSIIFQWIRNSYDSIDDTVEKEKLERTELLTSYYKFYITGTSVVETYQYMDLEGTDKIVEIGYLSATTLNKFVSMVGFMFVVITLSFTSLVYEDTITNLFLDLFTYINETIFDFTNPTSFGWLFLGIMMLLILLYKIVDSLKKGSFSFSEIGKHALRVFVTGIIITYSFTEITPRLINFRNDVHNDVVSYVSGGNTSEKSMNQKSMLFDMLCVNPYIIQNFGFESYDALLEDTTNKIDNQISEGVIDTDSLVEIYGSKAIDDEGVINYEFIADSRLIGVSTNNFDHLYYEYDDETKKYFDENPVGGNKEFTYDNQVIPGNGVEPYWELMGFSLIMLIHTILMSVVVMIIVMMAQLTTIIELAVYCFLFVLLSKLMWVDGKRQVMKNIRARISFFIICLVLAVFYEMLIVGLNALTVKAIKEGFVVLLVSDVILVILLVMFWKFKMVILKTLVRKVIPAFFKGESVVKRIQDAGGVKNIAKANVEKLKTNFNDSTKNQDDLINDLKKSDQNKALLYDSYLNGSDLKRKQKKKLRKQLRDEVKANHTMELSKVDDIDKLETLTKKVFKQESDFILDQAKTMNKEKQKQFLKNKISEKTKRKVFYDSEFKVPSSKAEEDKDVITPVIKNQPAPAKSVKTEIKEPKIVRDYAKSVNENKLIEKDKKLLNRKASAKDKILGNKNNEKGN